MKYKKKLYSIALASTTLVFVFLILISAIASAAQEVRLTQNGVKAIEPAIYDDRVVWSDDTGELGIIHLYNLTAGKET